jgi:hypothetical protein
MDILGSIETTDSDTAFREAWIALIGAHSSLTPIPPREGINPFTRKPLRFVPHRETARVVEGETPIGHIHWAEDGTNRLVVWSETSAATRVTAVANEIAARLGIRFIPSSAD